MHKLIICLIVVTFLCIGSSWAQQAATNSTTQPPQNSTDKPQSLGHFCELDLDKNPPTGIFRLANYLFIRVKQPNLTCQYFAYNLSNNAFFDHTMECSKIIGADIFQRIVGQFTDRSKKIWRVLGYGNNGLMFRDYKVKHDYLTKKKNSASLRYSSTKEAAKFIEFGKMSHESLLAVFDVGFGEKRQIIGFARLDGPAEHDSVEKVNPNDKYRRVVLVGPSGGSKMNATMPGLNVTMSLIVAAYQSVNAKWAHLIDEQNKVLTIPMAAIQSAFNTCPDCKMVQLDQESLQSESKAKMSSIKEHLLCFSPTNAKGGHLKSKKGTQSQLMFIKVNFWHNFKELSVGVAISFALCAMLIGFAFMAKVK